MLRSLRSWEFESNHQGVAVEHPGDAFCFTFDSAGFKSIELSVERRSILRVLCLLSGDSLPAAAFKKLG